MNFKQLTNYMDSLESSYGIPGCDCIVTKDHETVYRHSCGYSDYEHTTPVSDKDMYMLFSATKIVTVTAVMQLFEQGRLGLYDELTKYFPSFGQLRVADYFKPAIPMKWPDADAPCHIAHNSIRIVDLLTMTAGLSYDDDAACLMKLKKDSGNMASTADVVSCIAQIPLVYEPRTRWVYSLSHDVLAGVVEKVTGERYSAYLEKNIFQPLGITNLKFRLNEKEQKHLAALYSGVIENGTLTDKIKPYPEGYNSPFVITDNYESGGAGLYGTASDYSKLIEALANYGKGRNGARILKPGTVRLLMTPYTTGMMQKDFVESGKEGYSYGLGVRVLTDPNKSLSSPGEFGWDGAAGAYIVIDPKAQVSIFYIQHIFGFPKVYSEIHPKIRDLAYEGMEET